MDVLSNYRCFLYLGVVFPDALINIREIKFVEKEEKESILYSLSDFGTSGKNGVRNGENYLKKETLIALNIICISYILISKTISKKSLVLMLALSLNCNKYLYFNLMASLVKNTLNKQELT